MDHKDIMARRNLAASETGPNGFAQRSYSSFGAASGLAFAGLF
jgi:hypothetical protein